MINLFTQRGIIALSFLLIKLRESGEIKETLNLKRKPRDEDFSSQLIKKLGYIKDRKE